MLKDNVMRIVILRMIDGDNRSTIRCQLPPNHKGMHREVSREGKLIIEWEEDERTTHV